MAELDSLLNVVHVLTAVLMAWPFYALVAVNQRVRLGPPLGDRVDVYLENIIKNRTVPALLGHVHMSLQPRIDALFTQAQEPVSADMVALILDLRLRRKRLASVCLFVVLVLAMLGVRM